MQRCGFRYGLQLKSQCLPNADGLARFPIAVLTRTMSKNLHGLGYSFLIAQPQGVFKISRIDTQGLKDRKVIISLRQVEMDRVDDNFPYGGVEDVA